MTFRDSELNERNFREESSQLGNADYTDIEKMTKPVQPLLPSKKYKKKSQYFTYLKKLFLPLIIVGILTGAFCGVITGLYQFLSVLLIKYNMKIFSFIQKHLIYLPAAYGVNIIIGLILGFAIDYLKEIRGSGIPYIESVARGNITLTWYYSLPGMFFVSLAAIFSGLTVGSEGPSVFIGGCIGYAIGKIIKMNQLHDMLLVAAGSSAGLAVAFDAPLTGMIFALEEVYRKFSTQIILVSVICVSSSQLISHLIYGRHILKIKPLIISEFGHQEFGISMLCGVCGGILGTIFNILIYKARNLFKQIKFIPMKLYVIIPEIIAVTLCTFFPNGAYGGSSVLKMILNEELKTWEMGALFAVRMAAILICFGSKVSGGIFIPMLSVGALLGGLIGKLMVEAGWESEQYSFMVLMTMSAFFTGVVRAPLTAVILPVELTLQFAGWLGPITSVACAYVVAETFRVQPLYEKLMELLVEKRDDEDINKFDEFSYFVSAESVICNLTVREIILPQGTTLTHIVRDHTLFFPSENTQILEGDEVFIMCEIERMDEVQEQMAKVF